MTVRSTASHTPQLQAQMDKYAQRYKALPTGIEVLFYLASVDLPENYRETAHLNIGGPNISTYDIIRLAVADIDRRIKEKDPASELLKHFKELYSSKLTDDRISTHGIAAVKAAEHIMLNISQHAPIIIGQPVNASAVDKPTPEANRKKYLAIAISALEDKPRVSKVRKHLVTALIALAALGAGIAIGRAYQSNPQTPPAPALRP